MLSFVCSVLGRVTWDLEYYDGTMEKGVGSTWMLYLGS
jgi:hypothetical protein